MTPLEIIHFISRNNPKSLQSLLVSLGEKNVGVTPATVEASAIAYFSRTNDLRPFASIPYNNGANNETGGMIKNTGGAAGKLFENVNFGQILGGVLSGVGGVLTGTNQSNISGSNGLPLQVNPDPATKETLNTIKIAFIALTGLLLITAVVMIFKSKK